MKLYSRRLEYIIPVTCGDLFDEKLKTLDPRAMMNMARGVIPFWYLANLLFSAGINDAGNDGSLCLAKTISSTSTVLDRSILGIVVYKVPYRWCTVNCPGWTRFSTSDIELVLLF